ncbi:Putrescine transport ATP-binding protein PotA (TC 3.A.1.11.1) [hydrothermal vent metagenome]|uniref:Putrescine transport ATP-binding protein PotA (TC 3.A.1.11.1) n=1 Tax=hydrothermal vent metagenome TaxID=652676 RepID=A0A3B0WFR1_9ZZZZ
MSTIRCQHLSKTFANQPIVQNISLTVPPNTILALLGPSGCGKTTTLRLMAGFERLDNGRIEIDNQLVADETHHLPPEKRRIGIVFQDYAIFPHLNLAQNVGFGLKKRGQAARIAEMLAFVGLAEMGERMPHELSGGQQQRVALARALAPQPAVLLLDEPFSNLDATLRVEMRQEVRQLLKKSKTTAVFVTHDQEEALFMGDQVGVMNAGRLEQVGTPEAIFHRPRTRFVAQFLGQTDFVLGEVTAQGVQTVLGLLPQQLALPHNTPVEVAVRPDDLIVLPDDAGNGRIVSRQFLGIAFVYRIQLADGTLVHSWQPHENSFMEGTAVSVQLTSSHALTCFHQNRAISDKSR